MEVRTDIWVMGELGYPQLLGEIKRINRGIFLSHKPGKNRLALYRKNSPYVGGREL